MCSSADEWILKYDLYICWNIIQPLEGNVDTCYSMSELWKYYSKENKPVTNGKVLYDSTYMNSQTLKDEN